MGSDCKWIRVAVIIFLFAGCLACNKDREKPSEDSRLVGAWKSKIQFQSGPFAAIKDLEFMYAFNTGGTMNESSNYDAAPPVPPAYGIWRELGPYQFEAKYEFYITRTPTPEEAAAASGGWLPGGRGVLVERITLSPDANSFTSNVRYDAFDQAGKSSGGGGAATARAERLTFK